jgi:stage II sporulation protein E
MKSTALVYGSRKKSNTKPLEKKSILKILTDPKNLLYPISFFLSSLSLGYGLVPFSIAFFCGAYKKDLNKLILFLSIFLGTFFLNKDISPSLILITLILVLILGGKFKLSSKNSFFPSAFIGLFSSVLSGIIVGYYQNASIDFYRIALNGFLVFCLTFIFATSLKPIDKQFVFKELPEEVLIALSILIIFIVTSFSNLSSVGWNLTMIFYILLVLISAFILGIGAGTATGVCITLISSILIHDPRVFFPSLALCGLLAGSLRKLGKIGSSLGFLLGTSVFALYYTSSPESTISSVGSMTQLSAALFTFHMIPLRALSHFSDKIKPINLLNENISSYQLKVKEITSEKLKRFSEAFQELAKTFKENNDYSSTNGSQEVTALMDKLVDKVCKDCCLRGYCWEKNFYYTYQVTFKILEKLEEKGRIDQGDIPPAFLSKCQRIPDFIGTVNNTYEIFKVNTIWKNKLSENKEVFSKSLGNISGMISNLAQDLSTQVTFKTQAEQDLTKNLLEKGIHVIACTIHTNKLQKNEINLSIKGCDNQQNCSTMIEKIISGKMEKNFVKDTHTCQKNLSQNTCSLRFVEEQPYCILTGVAKDGKDHSSISGDHYTFLTGSDGKYILALSDGMGSGVIASKHSKTTINLLEQLFDSGLDQTLSLKLINSVLAIKTLEDSFTTLDLSIIDLYTAEVEFIKIGAVPTFIKRKNSVFQIQNYSLPVGVLSDLDPEMLKHRLSDGDFIVMLSDGMLEAFNNKDEKKEASLEPFDENRLSDFLQHLDSNNPQQIADQILSEGIKNLNQSPKDDMLVIVAKIWKRGS